MNTVLFWRVLAVQAAAVVVLSAILIALPLDHEFFEDWGYVVGPLAWLVCAVATGRILSLQMGLVVFSALASGVAAAIVALVASHWPGVIVGLLVFAASCASADREAVEPAA